MTIRISEFLDKNSISLDLKATTKKEVIEELVDLLVQANRIPNSSKEEVKRALMEREELGTTGIGKGVAIPHARTRTISRIVAAFGRSKNGVDFEAVDGNPVNLFFLIVSPEDAAGHHTNALARISRLLRDEFFRKALMNATSPEEVMEIIKGEEE